MTKDIAILKAFKDRRLNLIGMSASGNSFRMSCYVDLLKKEAGIDINELPTNHIAPSELHSFCRVMDNVSTPSQELIELRSFFLECKTHKLKVLFA